MPETAKLNLRLPPDLKEEASAVAEAMGLSLNAFVVQAVRNWAGYQADKLVRYQRTVRGPAPAPASVQDLPAAASRLSMAKVGANQPCPCGSGQKYKRCHGKP